MSKPAPIAIIGGGPCGLTFARLLERAGVDYVVFERDVSPEPKSHHLGGTLDLHVGTGLTALDATGLRDAFEKLARHDAAVFTVQDARGGNLFVAPAGDGDNDRPEIDRQQLRALLLDSVPAERIRWGKTLAAVERDDGCAEPGAKGWVLRFADGGSERGFRLVVGADGAWSAVRPLITPAKPRYSGKTMFEGRLTPPNNPQYAAAVEMVGPGNSAAMGAGRALFVQQMGDATYRVYAGVEGPETAPGGALDFAADPETARAALLALFADWAPHLRAFITHAEPPWRVWPLYTLEADAFAGPWTRAPGVTLLGDAAHLALPNGEGVNAAMLDALRLFECLAAELGDGMRAEKAGEEEDDAAVERAIVAYEAEMRERAKEHVADGIMMLDMMYSADGAERMIAMFKQFAGEAGQS
ncbi:monooxygenase [Ustulina deusta]|nr:monooxygenase [Ustulina deusta]